MAVVVEIAVGAVMGFFGSVPLAGPVALLVMTRGLSGNFKEAKQIAAGAALAEGLLAGGVFAGLGFLYSQLPQLEGLVEWLGSFALIAIGLWFLVRGVAQKTPDGKAPDKASAGFVLGVGLVLGNPGMIGTWGGALAALEGTGIVQVSSIGAIGIGLGVFLGVMGWFLLMLRLIKAYGSELNPTALNFAVRGIGLVLAVTGSISAASLLGEM